MTLAPARTLNNGVTLSALGYGVFQTPPDETIAAVEAALRTGYRHIDTAAAYGNEREVGEGLRRSGLDCGEVFFQTKVWISDYGYDATLHAFDKSAGKLGLDQIDLLILHQPMPARFDLTDGEFDAIDALDTGTRGGPVAYPGQTLYCPPAQEHWHGAAPDSFMEHLAMIDNADDPTRSTTWLEHVSDEEYLAGGAR